MTTSKRLAERKIEKFERNITKRGSNKKGDWKTGVMILVVFTVLVVGSYLFQIIRAALNE